MLPRRREFDLLRPEAAHHAESRRDRDMALLDKLGMRPMEP